VDLKIFSRIIKRKFFVLCVLKTLFYKSIQKMENQIQDTTTNKPKWIRVKLPTGKITEN
jgi:hypothetical protein